jgi:CBS domain-containing protein
MTTVSELMTKKVAWVRASDSLSAAAKQMWDCDCGVVPVLEDGSERVVGMITDRDICMATFLRDRSPSGIQVSDAMSRGLHACAPTDEIERAEDLMREKQVRRLPVVDTAGRLIGVLSLADIVRRTRPSNGKNKKPQIAADEVALTLANICEPPKNDAKPTSSRRSSAAS